MTAEPTQPPIEAAATDTPAASDTHAAPASVAAPVASDASVAMAGTIVVGPATSVFLVGPMGSGKSAVGRTLARLLGYGFVDSDVEIENRTGVDIPFIFEKEGEAGFRLREREILEELTRARRTVVSTGGGAVLLEENRNNLAERGVVVYLHASVDQQAERTRHGRHRPLLNAADDPRRRLAELMAFREPLYRSIAHLTVPTDHRRVQAVADDILAGLHGLGLPASSEGPTPTEL
jgi:shikimate kinase